MRLILLATLASALAFGQVTISDTLKIAQGNSTWNGTITVSSQDEVWSGASYARWTQDYKITSGVVSIVLIPGVGVYRATFRSSNGRETWSETWRIASETTPQSLSQVRVNLPSQTGTPAASYVRSLFSATAPITYSSTTGVIAIDSARSLPIPAGNGLKVVRVNSGGTAYELAVSSAAVAWGGITGIVTDQLDLAAYIASQISSLAPASHSHAGTDITSGYVGVIRLGSGTPGSTNYLRGDGAWTVLTSAEISASSKTGSGSKLATASGTPTDGCAEWASGEIGSSGSPCGTGGGATTSVASASQAFTSSASVTITHNFNSLSQVVACYDGSAQWIQPNSVTAGLSTTTVTFTSAQTGSCIDLGGTGLYSQAFTAQTSVSLTHSLGTQAIIVACYDDSNALVDPSSVVATSTSAATVTFSSAQTGSCVVAASLALTGGGGAGTVTSVGLSLPVEFSVSGSPITGAGTLAGSWASQAASMVLASPAGASGSPSFRALLGGDLPAMTGDTGSGGVKGAVPAPTAGDAAAGKYLKADGTWAVPPGGGGGTTYTAGDGIDATQLAAGVAAVDTTVPAIAVSGTQSLTFGTINQSSCSVQTITATGAVVGDRVIAGYPATLPDGLMGMMLVSATDTVQVRLCKLTTGSADVTGLTFTYQILRAR